MENWLDSIRHRIGYKPVRVIITIGIVFLSLAGVVSLSSDLGLGDEVTKYRWQIWLGLFIVSIISVLTYEVVKGLRKISTLNEKLRNTGEQLNEAKTREESLLRLMEMYKRAAYAEVLDHLNRLLILVTKREQWQASQAKVTKVRVRPYSGAENIDREFAKRERIDIVINIGQQASVCEGMEFLVRDPEIPLEYGIISVRKVHSDGATCVLIEELDSGFWTHVIEAPKQDKSKIIEVADNRIVPNLPSAFDSITPELADNLRAIISKIVVNQPTD